MINKPLVRPKILGDAFSKNLIAPPVQVNSLTSPILAQSHNPQAYAEKNKEYNVTSAGVVLERASAGFVNEQINEQYADSYKQIKNPLSRSAGRQEKAKLDKEKGEKVKKLQEWVPYQGGERHQPGVLGFNRI